jgi:putative inorganic carbon (HCO3(-)) transporter
MKRIKDIKITDFFIEFFYLAIIFLVPIYFGLFFITDNPFELQKMILFRVLFLIMAFLSVIKFIHIPDFKEVLKELFKKYFYIPLIILIFSLISLLWSIDTQSAFWGTADRQFGWISNFYFFLFFIFLSLNLVLSKNKKKKINRLISTIGLSSFLVSIYAVAQYFGYDFLTWSEPAYITKRSMSTLGQPNFLGSFLIMAIPLLAYCIKNYRRIWLKIIYIIFLGFNIWALICSGSRGAWVGLILSLFLSLFIFYFKKNKLIFYFGTVIIIFMGIILFFSNSAIGERFRSAFDFESGSSSVRISIWQASFKAIENRWWGYGLENQAEALAPYYEIDWAESNQVNSIPDKAHNLFLDHLITLGVIGLLLFLWFYFYFFRMIYKSEQTSKDKFLFKMFFVSLLAYLFSLLFNFAVVVTEIYFWAFIAIIINLDFNYEYEINEDEKKVNSFLFVFVILGASFAILGINREIKNLIVDYYYAETKNLFYQNEIPASMLTFSYLENQKPVYNYYIYNFIEITFLNHSNFKDRSSQFIAEKRIEDSLDLLDSYKNNSFSYLMAKTQSLVLLKDFSAVDDCFSKLQTISPYYPNIYFSMAKAEEYKNNFVEAEKYYNKTLEMLPEESHITSQLSLDALKNYKKMIKINMEKISK